MAIYERPVWQLMVEFAGEHPGLFRFAELDSWFQTRYPAIESSTLRAHLHQMTVGVSDTGSLPRVFTRVEHGLYRPSRSAEIPAQPALATAEPISVGVVLVTCVKTKRSAPAPAKELYISPLFQKQRAYAEQSGLPWFILSAEHGLVGPDEWLAPYERYLPDCPPSYRRAWARWVAARLELLQGSLRGVAIEIHASSFYASCLTPELRRLGASVSTPLSGLPLGERLAWYGEANRGSMVESGAEQQSSMVSELVDELADGARALRPVELRALGRERLSSGGLYSWWVDGEGARDLSGGLGAEVLPGLVYAGQAGATRWPSGGRANNTLWDRLVRMHLDGRARFSTFRRTIGSVLLEPLGLRDVDDPALSEWIEKHLRVVAVVVDDADALMAIEHQVLEQLDPPLNLKGMLPTPVRLRLSELRRAGRRS
ncbi:MULTISPECIES: DUF6884 domain-containing protein [unclassified Kribbella]|uniref:DUF6884 domain-containing protein n=1 Tax=unclassified Kribbella TaxID=2644121 RepID=UPI003019DB10